MGDETQKGRIASWMAWNGTHDHTLQEQVDQLDRDTDVILLRLSHAQAAAITVVMERIANSYTPELDNEEFRSLFHGLCYGFGLGHDYVQRHGPLAES